MKVLLTGGAGFLGRAIADELLAKDSPLELTELRIIDLKENPHSEDQRIRYQKADILNYDEIGRTFMGIDLVIHTAAIVDWGTKSGKEVYRINFEGTRQVIRACREYKVPNLLYTSSLDTVISGKPLVDIDETQPYPEKHPNMYCKSKYLAEKLVLDENSESLKTCVLRPSDIYGEGDPYHLTPLINMAKGGFYIRIGNGKAKSQHVYVRNIAWAHVLAGKALAKKNLNITGKAYFITDGPRHNFFSFFDGIVRAAGYRIKPENLWLPRDLAYFLGSVSEFIAFLVRPVKHYNPQLSRFAVMYTCTDFTFNSKRARDDFGFIPKYSQEAAIENTARYFQRK